jgi:hypothetical protein
VPRQSGCDLLPEGVIDRIAQYDQDRAEVIA